MLPSTCFQSCYSLLFCEHECPHLTVFTAFRIGYTQPAIIINFQTVKQVRGTHSLMRPASLPQTANANLSQPVSAPLHAIHAAFILCKQPVMHLSCSVQWHTWTAVSFRAWTEVLTSAESRGRSSSVRKHLYLSFQWLAQPGARVREDKPQWEGFSRSLCRFTNRCSGAKWNGMIT